MSPSSVANAGSRERWRRRLPELFFVGLTGVFLLVWARGATMVVFLDGILAAALAASAAGWGSFLVIGLRARPRSALRHLCIATAAGFGILATLTLILGVVGALNYYTAAGLLACGLVAGAFQFVHHRPSHHRDDSLTTMTGPLVQVLVLAPLIVSATVLLCAAALPPGVVWFDEARGYDVLEYHLQAPREYFDAGRIHFLAHNVYASFPQQMEMLYLLQMHLVGDPYDGAIPAHMLHALCAILAVLAAAAWAPNRWGGVVAAVVVGTTPWLAYLGALAYVELGLLMFAVVAGGLLMNSLHDPAQVDWRTMLLAGLCAGWAGGCKYTALAFVAAALGIVWFVAVRCGVRRRIWLGTIYGAGVLLAFSPWLIRNIAFTGNPVYPFAYEWFGGVAWSAEQAEQWARGHVPTAELSGMLGRLVAIRDELLLSWKFGPLIWLAGVVGVFVLRNRIAAMLAGWAAVMIVIWAMLTHMPGRFAVPLIAPLGLLAGRTIPFAGHWRPRLVGWLILVTVGGGVNTLRMTDTWFEHGAWWRKHGVAITDLFGATDAFVREIEPVNRLVPVEGKVWLVGNAAVFYVNRPMHYTVVFNRDPWLEASAEASPSEAIDWLRRESVTHVVFSWDEIDRLARSYGFPAIVTRAWVAQLDAAGLKPVAVAGLDPNRVAIYQVPAQ